jgi:hypothetical protein
LYTKNLEDILLTDSLGMSAKTLVEWPAFFAGRIETRFGGSSWFRYLAKSATTQPTNRLP